MSEQEDGMIKTNTALSSNARMIKAFCAASTLAVMLAWVLFHASDSWKGGYENAMQRALSDTHLPPLDIWFMAQGATHVGAYVAYCEDSDSAGMIGVAVLLYAVAIWAASILLATFAVDGIYHVVLCLVFVVCLTTMGLLLALATLRRISRARDAIRHDAEDKRDY